MNAPSRAHAASHPAAPGAARRLPWLGRLPWLPIAITLLVFITAALAVDPIRDAIALDAVGEGRLELSAGYLAITPLSNVLDTLTLLAVPQHIALLLWVIAVYAAYRVWRGRRGAAPRATSIRRELVGAIVLVVVIVLVYAAAAVLPRPMAQLVLSDPTVLAIDFHSHTKYSHDGRSGWSEDDVRSWHRAAGFDVAFITDHATFEGAERGIASNPGQAGEGTLILQGLEVVDRGEHLNMLDAGRRYRGLTTPDLKDLDEQALTMASMIRATAPILIETIPGNLRHVHAASDTSAGVSAIEVIDGSPRGLTQGRRDRVRIVHLADSLNLAPVAGSDNHGWGRAAPGWTLMRVPGWRGMTTDSLAARIEDIIRMGRREATRVVERRVGGGPSALELIFAGPIILFRMFTVLSADERVMWIVWTWGLLLLARAAGRWSAERRQRTPAA